MSAETARLLIQSLDWRDQWATQAVAEAQVHATLALVEAQERTAAALERIAGEKGTLGVEVIA